MLKEIKSKFIVQQIFELMGKSSKLKIAHRNRYLNTKLEITTNDYKEAYEIIEIGLKLSDNPDDYPEKDNYFINLRTNPDADKFEIFMDEEKLEKNIYSISKDNIITKNIKIKIPKGINSFRSLFECCRCIKEINIFNWVRKDVTDMSYMFYGCNQLRRLEISRMKSDNVTDMSYMFCECSSLKEINVSNLNTRRVVNMEKMFGECQTLEKLDLSNFITNNVTNMAGMFMSDNVLQSLNVQNFNIIKLEYMDKMFYDCKNLINLEMFINNSKVIKDKTDMFHGCQYVKEEIKNQFYS